MSRPVDVDVVPDLWGGVLGQPRAVAQLQAAAASPLHAYLFVGPPGTGKRAAASGFAASLLCQHGGCGSCADCRRALSGSHPDVVVRERTGAFISVDEAREIARLAHLSPVEGGRKVMVLVDFHLVERAAPVLLKSIEEPPATTVFVILAEHVPPELATIASRCVRVDFGPVPTPLVRGALESAGLDADSAERVATASAGRMDRAQLLASDPAFAAREEAWASVLARLDGTGATVALLTDELLEATDSVVEPLRARQQAELAALAERAQLTGDRGSGRRELEDRHRREQRRARTDELRAGLATLARACRDRLSATRGARERGWLEAVGAVQAAAQALERNPNEALLLQALLVRLSTVTAGAVAESK